MSPVDFKKSPCRPVKFRGQGPLCTPGDSGVRGTDKPPSLTFALIISTSIGR